MLYTVIRATGHKLGQGTPLPLTSVVVTSNQVLFPLDKTMKNSVPKAVARYHRDDARFPNLGMKGAL